MTQPLLSLVSVSRTFHTSGHEVRAVENVSFDVSKGECLAIVGESGSGKSTVANMILGIYPQTQGEILFNGVPPPTRRTLEHRRAIQLVQQNPLSSLNPRRTIGASLRLPLDVHGLGAPSSRDARVGELLEEVGLPADFRDRSPSALSGGQRQRVAIARALACQSELVVLDEPTSALDVLVQARVLKLLTELRISRGLTYIFITHDLSVVRNIADRVAVFERGKLLEIGETRPIFDTPTHSYTRKLIAAIPVVTTVEAALRAKFTEETDAGT